MKYLFLKFKSKKLNYEIFVFTTELNSYCSSTIINMIIN